MNNVDLKEFERNYNLLSDTQMMKKYDLKQEDFYKIVKELGLCKNNRRRVTKEEHVDIEAFKKDAKTYDNLELSQKYRLSYSTVSKLKRKLNLIKTKHKYYKENKYGSFVVNKYMNGKTVYFGSYRTEGEAQRAVEWFKQHTWNKNTKKRNNKQYKK